MSVSVLIYLPDGVPDDAQESALRGVRYHAYRMARKPRVRVASATVFDPRVWVVVTGGDRVWQQVVPAMESYLTHVLIRILAGDSTVQAGAGWGGHWPEINHSA